LNDLSSLLMRSVARLEREQLRTGEIPTYFAAGVGLQYRRSPLLSTFVHEALACFDPSSPWSEPELLELLAPSALPAFRRSVGELRRRIRAFLAWEEHCDGTWRFFGRASGVPADADLTARAATVLLETPLRTPKRRWQRHVDALARLRAPDGLFLGPLPPSREAPPRGFDLVGNTHALRFLALVGEDVDGLVDVLKRELAHSAPGESSGRYPGVLGFFYALSRAWSQGHLPFMEILSDRLLPRLLGLEIDDGDFGGPLSTALALAALLDLKSPASHVQRVRRALLRRLLPQGVWAYQAFVYGAGGSPSWTTALALSAVARATVAAGGNGE
jgi:hypothetical protein